MVLGSVAITLLEIFVAFLQAFIFTFLTTLFIGQSIVFHHHDDHEHDGARRRTDFDIYDRSTIGFHLKGP